MRERKMKRLLVFACAVAGLLWVRGAEAQAPPAAKPAVKKASPTAAEAKKFIEEAEQRLFELGLKASRAGWVQENFITDDTQQIAAEAAAAGARDGIPGAG